MDIQEHDTQVRDSLAKIDHDLKSLRLTFGIVLIIVTVLLAIAAPVFVRLEWGSLVSGETRSTEAPGQERPAMREPAPAAAGTTTAPVATTTKP
jgi:hypothetical protein